jgi:multisubunit Na+/H+ antiporter MnhE subunit
MIRERLGQAGTLLGCCLLLTGIVQWANVVVGLILAWLLVWLMPVSRTVAKRGLRILIAGPVYLALVAWDVLLNKVLVARIVAWPGRVSGLGW